MPLAQSSGAVAFIMASQHLERCADLRQWRLSHAGELPKRRSDNQEEASLAMWLSKALPRRVSSLGDGPSKRQLTPEETSHLNNILQEKLHVEVDNPATDSSSHHPPALKPQLTSGDLRSAERPPKRPRINEVLPKDSKSLVQRDIRDHFAELPIRSTPATDTKAEDRGSQHNFNVEHALKESVSSKGSKHFDLEHTLEDTAKRIESLGVVKRMMVRVIDHACSSPECVSNRVVHMMRSLFCDVSEDLSNKQALNACGYIAADATCSLRDAALSKSNSWFDVQLKNYSVLDCVHYGERALGKHGCERILSSDDVNRLVRIYSGIDQRHQAAEEWYAGALALDHFLGGLPTAIKELHDTKSFHKWRAWIVNTQTSKQRGSHWFTLAMGVYLASPIDAQMQEITTDEAFVLTDMVFPRRVASASSGIRRQANGSSSSSSVCKATAPPQNEHGVAACYPQLVQSAETRLATELLWAHQNHLNPVAAKVIKGCARWEEALTEGTYSSSRINRRALCQLDGIRISCNQLIESNTDEPEALQHIRELLAKQISDAHKPTKTLESFFRIRAPGEGAQEVQEAKIPDIATDVVSTYHRLRVKMRANADDEDLVITTKALYQLRGHVSERGLRALTQDAKGQRKTIRRAFTVVTQHHSSKLDGQRIHTYAPHRQVQYMVTLRVLAQARRWLSATECVHALEETPPTPRTTRQLANAIKTASSATYLPFGKDFEDADGYSPVIARLLFYAEFHTVNNHPYGSFMVPKELPPLLYRELQEKILELRRTAVPVDGAEHSTGDVIRCQDDLAACIYKFARDAIVAKVLVDFCLPISKRADAIVATEPDNTATPESSWMQAASSPMLPLANSPPSPVTNTKKRLSQNDDTSAARLSEHVAKSIARSFFKFVERERLQQHLSRMHAGQLLVLSLFHSRLAWQKGAVISLKDNDHYLLQKRLYTPASAVTASSPAYFRTCIQKSSTQRIEPEIQAPRICCLCGEGFIDMASLRKHCEQQHHSWHEARKRTFWEAEQMDAPNEDFNLPRWWLFVGMLRCKIRDPNSAS